MIETREKQPLNIERATDMALQEMRKIAGDKQFKDNPDSLDWVHFNRQVEGILTQVNKSISDREERMKICKALWEKVKAEGERLNLFLGPEDFQNRKTGILAEVATGAVLEIAFKDKYRPGTDKEDAGDGCDYMLYLGNPAEEKCIQLKTTRNPGRRESWVNVRPGGYQQTVELVYDDETKGYFNSQTGMPTKKYYRELLLQMKESGLAN